MHTVYAGSTVNMPSFDGLSGSPVFSVANPDDPSTEAKFAGMLLRGVSKYGKMHFVAAEQIARVIEHNIFVRTMAYIKRLDL
jgi:hypothetical protein